MDEKDCEVLITLNQTRNITKTAEMLFISQPAVTKRLQHLEEELGCELLIRSKKGVIFTPAGERIIPYASELLSNLKLIHEEAALGQSEICGSLSIGSSLDVAHYKLPNVLKIYSDKYPLVDIHITTGHSSQIYQQLTRDEFALGIIRGEFEWTDGRELLSSEPMCLVCSKENIGRPLDSYTHIGRNTDTMQTAQLRKWQNSHGLSRIKTNFFINDIAACTSMVQAGLGWAILPQICLKDFDGYVEELTLDDGAPFMRNTYVMYRSPYLKLPQVKLFLEQLKASF